MQNRQNRLGISILFAPVLVAVSIIGVSRLSGQEAKTEADAPEKKPAVAKTPVAKTGAAKTDAAKTGAAKTGAAKTESAKTEAKSKPAIKNPVQNLIRNIFGGGGPRAIPNAKTEAPEVKPLNGDRQARDHIDARAAHVPEHAGLLRTVKTQIAEGRYDDALLRLQLILDIKEDSLVRSDSNRFVSVRAEANRLMASLPEKYIASYQLVHGPAARVSLEEAIESGDKNQLTDVATQYFHTEAGQQAANLLGSQFFDAGRFGMAARWLGQLDDAKSSIAQDSMWKLRAALAFRQSGDETRAASILASIKTGTLNAHGTRLQPTTWLNRVSRPIPSQLVKLDDWRMPFGTPNRMGVGTGGEPLLLPRWSHPISAKPAILERVATLLEDLEDQQLAPIPASFPITVDGKVIMRTFRGVHVLDAENGKLLWHSDTGDEVSPDTLLTGVAEPEMMFGDQVQMGFNPMGTRVSSNTDSNALTGLLFRNGLYGTLTSDGERIYVIQSQALFSQPGRYYGWRSDPNQNDAHRRDWNTNKVAAYWLKDGRIAWEIGDTATGETFDRPLAGWYLFGPPVPDGNELFVVGEKDSEIRLFSLSPENGRQNWSQLIAFTDSKIAKDAGRRLWPAMVSSDKGVLVCPTTVGWLVAVERGSQRFLWAHRYSTPTKTREYGNQATMVPQTALNGRWCTSAPMIVGNRVIYAPSEHDNLECLHLFSGERLWKAAKGSGLYVAGVFDDQVVIVDSDSVKALSIKDGTTKWTTPIDPNAGKPSGVGVAIDDHYHLPLLSGQLWTLNLKTGKVLRKSFLPEESHALGNLTMYRGMLLSMSPMGLTSFEQKDFIEHEIARRKELSPNDAWALLREAEISLQKRDFKSAWESLAKADTREIEADLKERLRDLSRSTLAAWIRADVGAHGDLLKDLHRFIKTPDEQLDYDRLVADRALSTKNYGEAFDVYWKLINQARPERMVIGDDEDTQVQIGLWLSGRLADLWKAAPAPLKATWEAKVAERNNAVIAGGKIGELNSYLRAMSFHPSASHVRSKLIALHQAAGEFAKAEIHLLHLTLSDDPAVAMDGHLELAEHLVKNGLMLDAARRLDIAELHSRSTKLAEPDAVANRIARARRGLTSVKRERIGWSASEVRVVQMQTDYSSSQMQVLLGELEQLPFLDRIRIQVETGGQSLRFVDAQTDELYWQHPLRAGRKGSSNVEANSVGHSLFVMHRDALHCLSMVDRKALWPARILNSRGQTQTAYYRTGYTYGQRFQMQKGATRMNSQWGLTQQYTRTGTLAAVSPNAVCTYDRRAVKVFDPLTGDLQWIRKGRTQTGRIFATAEYVMVRDGVTVKAYRAIDGKAVTLKNANTLLQNGIRVDGNNIVVAESSTTSSRPKSTLAKIFGSGTTSTSLEIRSVDPGTDKESWKVAFGNDAYVTKVDNDTVAVMEHPADKDAAWKLATVDLVSGKRIDLTTVRMEDGKKVSVIADDAKKHTPHAIVDRDNLYLIFYERKNRNVYWGDSLRTMRVNGTFHAFDRRSGQHLWTQKVEDQNLVLQEFEHNPLITFILRKQEKVANRTYYMTYMMALDKRTGKRVASRKSNQTSSMQSVRINMADRYVDLQSYNFRFRFMAVDQTAAVDQDASPPKKSE
ncbi:MAG: PQQ-binding-like beta-propeller repeat protein [Planctomycetota bacterium]|nr:PQQ-binding-like beta-propeller repeat protein [Planctomycetota bacterium]